MKTKSQFSQNQSTESLMDFFPEPQTIPNGWDLSEILAASETTVLPLTKPHSTEETGNNSWTNH